MYGRTSSRRIPGGDNLARALLDAGEPLTFDELMAAAPDASAGDVAAWVGHGLEEGLLWGTEPGAGSAGRFSLRARGRRLFAARRRAAERQTP